MHTNAIIVSSIGFVLAIVTTLFIILSDLACIAGNVGSAGLIGPMGPTGDRGNQKQTVVSTDHDLITRDLTISHTQPTFAGNLLQENGNGYMISWWVLSALSQKDTTATLNFNIINNYNQVVHLTYGQGKDVDNNNIKVQFSLLAKVRQELSVKLYIWRKIDNQEKFHIAVEGATDLFKGTITDYDTANIAVRLKVTGDSVFGYNRANAINVYHHTGVKIG